MTCNQVLTDNFNSLANWSGSGSSLVPGRTGNGFQNFSGAATYSLAAPVQFDTVTVGFAFKFGSLTADSDVLYLFGDANTTQHFKLTLGNARDVYAWMGLSNLLGSTNSHAAFPAAGTWFYVECQVRVHDTLGFVKVWINGVLVLNLTGLDTKNAGTGTVVDAVRISCGNSFNTAVIDDFYLKTGDTCTPSGDPAAGVTLTLADTMYTKLKAHYPALVNPSLDDLLMQFATDNPTFIRPLGTTTFYAATTTETLADAATRWWGAYVP